MSEAPSIFAALDQEQLEHDAGKLLAAILAVVDFARPTHDDDREGDPTFYEAVIAKALIASLAAFVVHDHTDDEQQEAMLEGIVTELRTQIAALQVQS